MLHVLPSTLLRWLSMALLLTAVGCDSGSGGAKSLKALGIDDGASLGETTDALVTPDEEAMLSLKTGAQVKIPRGAVTKEVEIELKRPPDKEALKLVKTVDRKQKLASAPYVVKPHGEQFEEDVEVTLPVARGRNPQKLKVVWLEDEDSKEWQDLGKPEVSEDKATIRVKHFSVFALVEEDDGEGDSPAPGDGDGGPSMGNDLSARALARLTQCGLIARQGDYAPIELPNAQEECEFECILGQDCSVIEALVCETNLDEAEGLEQRCAEQCASFSDFTCANGDPVPAGFVCDGEADCLDGEDEADCGSFSCGDGITIPYDFECDGFLDCEDGRDEDVMACEGKLFTCDGGDTILPLDAVCDFYPDCSDGSDEHSGCAAPICDVGSGGETSSPSAEVGGDVGAAARSLVTRKAKTKAKTKRAR